MEDQFSIFEVLEDGYTTAPPEKLSPAIAPAPTAILTQLEILQYTACEFPLVANYVRLGWHLGGLAPRQTIFSAKLPGLDLLERAHLAKTDYLIDVPLPAAWLTDPEQHAKTRLLEGYLLEELGFQIERGEAGDKWKVLDQSKADVWKVNQA